METTKITTAATTQTAQRRLPAPAEEPAPYRSPYDKRHEGDKIFGVDPTTLQCVEDNGFNIPWHLAKLRKILYAKSGLETAGIFRLAGSEARIGQMRRELNDGTFDEEKYIQENNVNNINNTATLLTRWYGAFPMRILSFLPSDFLDGTTDPLMASVSLPEKLCEPYRTFFLWLVEILLDVARVSDQNKMTTHNLAVVVAPILSPETENIFLSLAVTGQVILLMENYLNFRLEGDTV